MHCMETFYAYPTERTQNNKSLRNQREADSRRLGSSVFFKLLHLLIRSYQVPVLLIFPLALSHFQKIGTFFSFADKCPNYLFQYPKKKTSYGAHRNVLFLQLSPSEAKYDGDDVGWHDRSWAHRVTHVTHRPK